MAIKLQAELVEKIKVIENVYHFKVKANEIANTARPGNFIEIRVSDNIEPFLRRPISIYNINKKEGILEFIFQVKGKGTEILCKKNIGEKIDIIGPLGNGTFKYDNYQNIAVIGGGIGIFPLHELCKEAKKDNKNINTYLGFRNKNYVMLEKEFSNVSNKLTVATDDGSYANKGFAIEYLKKDIENNKIDSIYACGPMPMLKAVYKFAIEKNIPCQLSLEELMACGLGVCLGCAVKTADSPIEKPEYVHVCKDGPVFDATNIDILN